MPWLQVVPLIGDPAGRRSSSDTHIVERFAGWIGGHVPEASKKTASGATPELRAATMEGVIALQGETRPAAGSTFQARSETVLGEPELLTVRPFISHATVWPLPPEPMFLQNTSALPSPS